MSPSLSTSNMAMHVAEYSVRSHQKIREDLANSSLVNAAIAKQTIRYASAFMLQTPLMLQRTWGLGCPCPSRETLYQDSLIMPIRVFDTTPKFTSSVGAYRSSDRAIVFFARRTRWPNV